MTSADVIFKQLRLKPARFVLVVEKDAIFQHLVEANFAAHNPCVLVTGRGFPDINTRDLVRKLACALGLGERVFGICDWNPFGFGVMSKINTNTNTYTYYVVPSKVH